MWNHIQTSFFEYWVEKSGVRNLGSPMIEFSSSTKYFVSFSLFFTKAYQRVSLKEMIKTDKIVFFLFLRQKTKLPTAIDYKNKIFTRCTGRHSKYRMGADPDSIKWTTSVLLEGQNATPFQLNLLKLSIKIYYKWISVQETQLARIFVFDSFIKYWQETPFFIWNKQ